MELRGDVAEWLGNGLQSRVLGFESRRRLSHAQAKKPARWQGNRAGAVLQRASRT